MIQLLLRRPWLALVAALVFQLAIYVLGQADMVAADALWYADIAHTLATKPASLFASHENHPFVMRLGLTVPLALFYRVFGVSTLVPGLPCLLAALGITWIVYAAAPTARGKLIGVALCV